MKVNKYDIKKSELLLAPTDPWRGLGTEPPYQGLLVDQNPTKIIFFSNKIQSTPRDHGGPRLPLRHECKLQTQHIGSPQLRGEDVGACR
jgi:hypothetical protein